ncbi:MAG: carboxypeptidase regulatory-like domain-containing protein [Clostridiales Family XIII bacterium]|nr:carboxypeptidase regulatory-like domain-containing protein [Clostridiales Family XIII bacterium]
MKKWHIVFDVDKCIGCYTCLLSCKDEHVGNNWLPYTDCQRKNDQKWIVMEKRDRGSYPRMDVAYRPKMCNHCAAAPCAANAPESVVKREDGVVLLNPARAKDKPELVNACPYGNISWNEEVGAAQKCTFCAHLLDDGWEEPRCVQSCPLKALRVVRLEDAEFKKLAKSKGLRAIIPEAAGPRVYYKNLQRFDKCFVAGEVAYYDHETETCAKNAEVRLFKDGNAVSKVRTNAFGDFRFEAVEPSSGKYTIEAELPGRGKASVSLQIDDSSVDIGTLYVK